VLFSVRDTDHQGKGRPRTQASSSEEIIRTRTIENKRVWYATEPQIPNEASEISFPGVPVGFILKFVGTRAACCNSTALFVLR
jgi:hypothetical protein